MSDGYGRQCVPLSDFVLIAISLRYENPTPANKDMVWRWFTWSAETLHGHALDVTLGTLGKSHDDRLQQEWELTRPIMLAWGYNPDDRQSCRDFDTDCKSMYEYGLFEQEAE